MMLVLWLIVWLCYSSPTVSFDPINDWAIALIICAALTLLDGGRRVS